MEAPFETGTAKQWTDWLVKANRADLKVSTGPLSVDQTNLPARVINIPSWSPEDGVFAQHLVDLGSIRGEAPLELDRGIRLQMPTRSATHFGSCEATLHVPRTGESSVGTCKIKPDEGSVWATFPDQRQAPPWSVVEVRFLSDEPLPFGAKPIRMVAREGPWLAPTVTFDVPFLDERHELSISLPESLRVEHPPADFDGNLSAWTTTAHVQDDGRSGAFRGESGGLTFSALLKTGDGRVDMEITVDNQTGTDLGEVEALLCASSRGASPFPDAGHGNTWIETPTGRRRLDGLPRDGGDPLYIYGDDVSRPMVSLDSVDGRWTFTHAFDGSAAIGGNGNGSGVCLHSRPNFGSLAQGASATRKGLLFVGPAGAVEVPEGWKSALKTEDAWTPKQLPCRADEAAQ